jgi:hypothetical protein
MSEFRFTLLSDGSSDQVLSPILVWLLRRQNVARAIQPVWADLRWLRRPPADLTGRIALTLGLYPCDLLFVHRDAEGAPLAVRRAEILQAVSDGAEEAAPVVCIVPVRMQEAWLLFDELAIRHAAGNPSGNQTLTMPRMRDLEALPDPKALLHEMLREASGLHGRRRRRFSVQTGARRVVEFIEDFSPLLELSAFQVLDEDLREIIQDHGWA